MSNSKSVTLGTAGGQTIIVHGPSPASDAPLVTLRLISDYSRTGAPGWPTKIPAGAVVTAVEEEADALLAAGVAVLA